MKLIELEKGTMYTLIMTGAEKDKIFHLIDSLLTTFENGTDEK